MNLVTEAWIPVVRPDGKPDAASLMQVFTEGKQFSDLAVRPHERIALMRLLICIAQAALKGPEDIEAWDNAPDILPLAAKEYLEEWRKSFNLFDSEKPFLQIAKLEKPPKEKPVKSPGIETSSGNERGKKKGTEENKADESNGLNPVSKLDFALASQNNSALFDHQATAPMPRELSPEWIALNLLVFQNFSSSGRIGVALWGKAESSGGGSSFASPCLQKLMLHTFIRRATLFDTICANLMTKNQVTMYLSPNEWGKPLWELSPNSATDQAAIANATETYLGRLVPLSRWIKIVPHGGEMILANGFTYPGHPDRPADATATEIVVEVKKKQERKLIKADEKSMWRQLPAILVKYANGRKGRSPLCLESQAGGDEYDIWVGGVSWSSEGGYLDTTESVLKIVPNLQTDSGVKIYEDEVLQAEIFGKRLVKSVREYRKQIDGSLGKVDDPDLSKKKKNEMESRLLSIALSTAMRHYWTAVEKKRSLLMAHVEAISTTAEAVEKTRDAWRKAVHGAARQAYELACGQETPRQIRAFALGLGKLFAKQQSHDAQEPETVEQED
jgi:CRISPR system Cascade subunit CasA